MKICSHDLSKPFELIVAFPRGDEDVLAFRVRAVRDFTEFNTRCPRPEPKTLVKPGGTRMPDLENPEFRAEVEAWASKRSSWLFLKSLEATDDLHWETVEMTKPETWGNYGAELENAHFSVGEINKLMDAVLTVNGFNSDAYEEARKRFLATQASLATD